jgi:hypothetical protein
MEENEFIPSGSESVEAETVEIHEDAPMLDVHPPYAAVHGWRDFWIHLGTITLGLLIAISLEQTVEWFHHLHQRHQLEADLRQEGVENQDLFQADLRVLDNRMAVIAAKLREVESTLAIRKKMPPPFAASTVPSEGGHFVLPLETAWDTAKESGLIDLLPRETARSYTRVYHQIDLFSAANAETLAPARVVQGYECLFSDGTLPCKPDLARMTNEQLEEYGGALARDFPYIQAVKMRLLYFEAANGNVQDTGSFDTDAAYKDLQRLSSAYPDTFLVPRPKTK